MRLYPTFNQRRYKPLGITVTAYFSSLLIFIILISPVLFPMLELYQTSSRANQLSFDRFIDNTATLQSFVAAQTFKWYSNVLYWASSEIYYFGAFNIALLLLLTTRRVRYKSKKYHSTTYALIALVAFMLSTSLIQYLYDVPPFGQFSGPHKYFQFALFFAMIAIAGIAQTITNNVKRIRTAIIFLTLSLSLFLNIAVLWQNKNNALGPETMPVPPRATLLDPITKAGRVFTFHVNTNPDRQYQLLTFDYATLFNKYHIGGYDTFIPKTNQALALNLNLNNNFGNEITNNVLHHLSQWSVKYFLTNNIKLADTTPSFQKINEVDGIGLYENTQARPVVYNPINYQQPVDYDYNVNRLYIIPNNKQAHELIVNIAPLPHYTLFINDKKIGPIKTTPTEPIKISVPAQTNKVTIKYIDNRFIVGIILSLFFWIGVSIIVAIKTPNPLSPPSIL